MAIFELQGPDGAIYEVDAPNEQSALSAFQGMSKAPQESPQESMIPAAIADVPKEIGSAFNESVAAIHEGLVGQSQRRRAQPAESFLGALGQTVSDTMGVGKALAAIPGLVASPITGAARSLIGHPYSDVTGIPYEEAKGNVDTALMALGPKNFTTKGANALPKPVPSADEIRSAAVTGFENARNSGVTVPATDVQAVAQRIRQTIRAEGGRDKSQPKTFGVLDELENPAAGAVADVGDLHSMRKALGHAARDKDEAGIASMAMKELDNYISTVSPELKTAIDNYAAVKRSDTVQGRMDRADLNASSANSGTNLDNAIRQQIKGILTSEKERRGYTKQELDMMRSIVKASSPSNLVRGLGNLLGGGGGLGALAAGGAGATLTGPMGLAAPAVGWLVKQFGNRLTAGKVRKLDEAVRSRSPLAQSMPSQVVPMPKPAFGGLLPAQLQGLVPQGLGQMPAYADENQRRAR